MSALTSFFACYTDLLKVLPYPWVDAGAYKGTFIDACLAHHPEAQIEAFEPQPRRVAKLRKKYIAQPNIHIHAKALGVRNVEVPLHITAGNAFSSVLLPAESLQEAQGERVRVGEIVCVEQIRLDSVLDTPPGLLKLDVQGAELDCLLGCGALLHGVGAVLVELGDAPRYAQQPPAEAVHTLLLGCGLRVQERWSHPVQGSAAVYDVLYVRA